MRRTIYLVMTDQIEGGFVFVIKGVLWCLSCLYRLLLAVRKVSYRIGLVKTCRLSKPVLSVGNITVGGSGKTPFVEFMAKVIKEKGIRPVVLMRGYMVGDPSGRSQKSDEADMLRTGLNIPVLVGADRTANAKSFLKDNDADVFLLDDGFQHWRLKRDIDIVTIDATNPWGNGHLLPRGILREPKEALSRADVFVLTKVDIGGENMESIRNDLQRTCPGALIVESIHRPVSFLDLRLNTENDLKSVRGENICTVCSIGSPNSFIKTVVELEVDIGEHFPFSDHHVYRFEDVDGIIRACEKKGIKTIITTQKDAAKWREFMTAVPGHIRVLVLKIEIAIVNGEDEFIERIDHLL